MTMLHYTLLKMFAQAYGAGSYGTSAYSTGSSTTGGGSGSLSDTGIAIAAIVTIAALTLLVALVVRIMRRPSKSQVAEAVQSNKTQE